MRIHFLYLALLLSLSSYSQSRISYSIDDQAGKYTYCTDSATALYSESLALKLAKAIYKLNDIDDAVRREERKADENDNYVFDTLLNINKRALAGADIQYINNLLDSSLSLIMKVAAKDTLLAARSTFRRFNIKLTGNGMNLVAPVQPGQTLNFSKDILENVFKNALIDLFLNIENDVYDNFDFDFEGAAEDIFSPLTYLQTIKKRPFVKTYCLPYISSNDVLEIIKSGKYFKDNLTRSDRSELEFIQTCFEYKRGEILDEDGGECFSALLDHIDDAKLDGDLKRLIDKVKHNGLSEKEAMQVQDEMEFIMNMYLLSNFINMEVYKYLIFVLAHESYHVWYPEIGTESEYKADYFACILYLEIFQDDKLRAVMGGPSMKEQSGDEEDGFFSVGSDNQDGEDLLQNMMGRPINMVFASVLKRAGYYEKITSLHPPVPKRIDRLKALIKEKSLKSRNDINNEFHKLIEALENKSITNR